MINNIEIKDFKCLHNEYLSFKPLTIITGLNSSGKSSLLQTILIALSKQNTAGERILKDRISIDFQSLRNKYQNSSSVGFTINNNGFIFNLSSIEDNSLAQSSHEFEKYKFEENCFYLSAERLGVERYAKVENVYKIGANGEYIFATFEQEKSKRLHDNLIKYTESYTLGAQVNYWLSYITGFKTELKTEMRPNDSIEVSFNSDGLSGINPINLGTGVSYLVKILITLLRSNPGDIIIIENPEIHLHPASQAKLGEFVSFIANAGIQVIIETHCEHLINKIAYEIYRQKISNESCTILYKESISHCFQVIDFSENGKFSIDFPNGFFDATLSDLIEME